MITVARRVALSAVAGCFSWGAMSMTMAAPTSLGTGNSDGPREIIVAQDGSGQFKTVQEAIAAAPTGTPAHPSVIHIKPGIYKEVIYAQREKRFLRLIGDGAAPAATVITYDLNAHAVGPDGKPIGTFRTATANIDADDLTIENLTFENAAGNTGQALAVRVDGDRVVFRKCRLLGWQDTLLANRGRQYFEECEITGAVDFIFGGATAYFERCQLHCAGTGYVTAASTPDNQAYGFVFSHCKIDATPAAPVAVAGAAPAAPAPVQTYLGRPWRDYASVVFLNTEMSDVVRSAGWSDWGKLERAKTARYAEFGNTGAGSGPQGRVDWMKHLTDDQAKALTPLRVLGGADHWDPTAST